MQYIFFSLIQYCVGVDNYFRLGRRLDLTSLHPDMKLRAGMTEAALRETKNT